MIQCRQKSAEGYECQLEVGHTGPCSRVMWRLEGKHRRVYWWPSHESSEHINQFTKPEE